MPSYVNTEITNHLSNGTGGPTHFVRLWPNKRCFFLPLLTAVWDWQINWLWGKCLGWKTTRESRCRSEIDWPTDFGERSSLILPLWKAGLLLITLNLSILIIGHSVQLDNLCHQQYIIRRSGLWYCNCILPNTLCTCVLYYVLDL